MNCPNPISRSSEEGGGRRERESAMKESSDKKPKKKEPEIDFTQFTVDDIARRMLATPPKPKTGKKKKEK